MSEAVLHGGCFCGSVRYSVAGGALHLCFCHCASCRRAAGAPMVPWGTFPDTQFAVIKGEVVVHHSSPGVSRGFCRNCGTSLTYAHEQRPGEIDITLVTLDEPEILRPTCHIWVRDKLSWVMIADGLHQFETVSASLALSTEIDCPFTAAYDFLSMPEHFPLWASGLAGSLEQIDGQWFADTPAGRAGIRFSDRNAFGVLDHWVMLPNGATVYIPLRIIANGRGCELTLTLFRQPDMDDAKFAADAEWVRKDLAAAKKLLERK